jgi:hypothetical protein
MPDITLKELRRRTLAMEPKMRAALVELIVKHRPDYLVGHPDAMTTHQLLQLAESCVPKVAKADDPARTPSRPSSFVNVLDIGDPNTRLGRRCEVQKQRERRREELRVAKAEARERADRYRQELRERSRKRG